MLGACCAVGGPAAGLLGMLGCLARCTPPRRACTPEVQSRTYTPPVCVPCTGMYRSALSLLPTRPDDEEKTSTGDWWAQSQRPEAEPEPECGESCWARPEPGLRCATPAPAPAPPPASAPRHHTAPTPACCRPESHAGARRRWAPGPRGPAARRRGRGHGWRAGPPS